MPHGKATPIIEGVIVENCWYSGSASDFLNANLDSVYANMVRSSAFDINDRTKESWDEEILFLRKFFNDYPAVVDGQVVFEYPIPQLRGRIDVVLLYKGVVFLLEFKTGKADKHFAPEAKRQVLRYALDVKYFHAASKNRKIVPVLVVPSARGKSFPSGELLDGVRQCQCCSNQEQLSEIVVAETAGCEESEKDVLKKWLNSAHSPVPTIVDVARALYAQHKIEDLTKTTSGDDTTDIKATIARINEIINEAKAQGQQKVICLLTGVPGAGKTLVGLSLAIDRNRFRLKGASEGEYSIEKSSEEDEKAIFLSGNGPLVAVLQKALADDARRNRDAKLKDLRVKRAGKEVKFEDLDPEVKSYLELALNKTFVMDVMGFRNGYFNGKDPSCQIAIFDEAQRAWTNKQLVKKNGEHSGVIKDQSEPACLIDQMNKRKDWAVIVCLVGGGQEIHDGEAGIVAWLDALMSNKFANWKVHASDFMCRHPEKFELKGMPHEGGSLATVASLFADLKKAGRLTDEPRLHLNVNNRSVRSDKVSALADALVNGQGEEAKLLLKDVIKAGFPVFVTRSLQDAKEWVKLKSAKSDDGEPLQRYGILATSTEQRLRAEGILVPKDMNIVSWMLGDFKNVDSSFAMELAASEFEVQGLEIDYAVVVWGGDYRYEEDANRKMSKKERASLRESFHCSGYSGHGRTACSNKTDQDYLRNAYRVLLTRSRMGFVIYVPKGDDADNTRHTSLYSSTYKYLTEIVGLVDLKDVPKTSW